MKMKCLKRLNRLCILFLLLIVLGGCEKNYSNRYGDDRNVTDKNTSKHEEPYSKENEGNEEKSDDLSNKSNEGNIEKTASGIDNEVGFKSKSYEDYEELTEGQKKVQQYFNTDYFWLVTSEYEFLQRYPDVFKGTEIKMSGTVEKIISNNGNKYEMLVWIGPNEETFSKEYYYQNHKPFYESLKEETKQNLVVIKGEYESVRWIQGDEIAFIGTYEDMKSYDIDGTSYHLPVVDAYNVYIDDEVESPILYDADYIKDVAKNIFGEDIMITQGDPEIDINDFDVFYKNHQYYWEQILNGWYYTCELENQSNAKFSKYYFFSQYGVLIDAKSTDKIQRIIEFAPDFEHFFLLIADNQLNTLTLEYYDKDLNKIWKQEFAETVSAAYDYTSTNVYVVVNNELHIFDIETGKATISPSFVGDKRYMRKLEDGILVLDSSSPADSIMKIDLEGNILWKNNTSGKICSADTQIVDDKIILYIDVESDGGHYMVIDNATGKILTDAVSLRN